MTYMGIIGDI